MGNDKCDEMAIRVYNMLETNGKDVLYDDSNESAGSKLASMDLIGIPYQIIIGPRLAKDDKFEIKNRLSNEKNIVSFDRIFEFIK